MIEILNRKKQLYIYETSPLDYWHRWQSIYEFDEYLKDKIKRFPCQSMSYLQIWSEINDILLILGKLINPPRGEFIRIFMLSHDSMIPGVEDNSIFVGIKEDNNGQCKAFSYSPILVNGEIALPHDFDDEWREVKDEN